jgi:hypothetical protein
MKTFLKWVSLTLLLALPLAGVAQSTVNQGQGQSSGSKPWAVKGAATGGATSTVSSSLNVGPGTIKTGAPNATVSTSAVSAAATGLTAGLCYRIACSAPVFFRTGTGTPVALTTDNAIFGPAVEKVCMQAADTAVAFIMAAGTGSCTVATLN